MNQDVPVTMSDNRAAPLVEETTVGIHWTPVVAGALGAAALGFVLHSFAVAIGMSVSSTAPTWRDTSFMLVFASGLYILLVALASYGFGAYLAARMRDRVAGAAVEHVEFRDGIHGLIVWALATLLTGLLALAAVQALPRLTAPTGTTAGPANSIAGENLIASDLDRLFRSDRSPTADLTHVRGEAGRILLTTASHNGMQTDDRTYLVHLVASTTGLSSADADRRVTQVAANAKADIDRARHSAVVLAFMTGAAALLGAVVAWFAACAGGRHRDGREAAPSYLDWSRNTYARR